MKHKLYCHCLTSNVVVTNCTKILLMFSNIRLKDKGPSLSLDLQELKRERERMRERERESENLY